MVVCVCGGGVGVGGAWSGCSCGKMRDEGGEPGCDSKGHADGDRFPPEVDRRHVCCSSCARKRCRPGGSADTGGAMVT